MGRASVLCPRAGGGTPTVGTCPAAAVGQPHVGHASDQASYQQRSATSHRASYYRSDIGVCSWCKFTKSDPAEWL